MIVVFVQTANGNLFFRTSQLSVDKAVFSAGAGFQCESAVGPQLALSAKTVRSLDQRHG